MQKHWRLALVLLMCAPAIAGLSARSSSAATDDADVAAAMKALDEYMAAFNSRDEKAWAATLNYPHVRIAGGEVKVWQTPEEYCADFDFAAFAKKYDWDHSAWDKREVVQKGPGKVHVCVTFSRYNVKGEKLETYDSLYVLTNKDGHWGTLARSSYAP
jgi:hypothetical protein